ncbi:unnamed protein product [Closterium sp. NIES-53]
MRTCSTTYLPAEEGLEENHPRLPADHLWDHLRGLGTSESSREQQRAAASSSEQQRAAESSREQQRAAESSREQQRAAESSEREMQDGAGGETEAMR